MPMPQIPTPQVTWKGILMLVRPDTSKMPHLAKPMIWALSPIRIEYGGRRAIAERFPYAMLAHYFKDGDGDSVEVYAEMTGGDGGHLQFYERASKSEFFLVPEQGTLPQAIAH